MKTLNEFVTEKLYVNKELKSVNEFNINTKELYCVIFNINNHYKGNVLVNIFTNIDIKKVKSNDKHVDKQFMLTADGLINDEVIYNCRFDYNEKNNILITTADASNNQKRFILILNSDYKETFIDLVKELETKKQNWRWEKILKILNVDDGHLPWFDIHDFKVYGEYKSNSNEMNKLNEYLHI